MVIGYGVMEIVGTSTARDGSRNCAESELELQEHVFKSQCVLGSGDPEMDQR